MVRNIWYNKATYLMYWEARKEKGVRIPISPPRAPLPNDLISSH
jgi:hypothetical protein